MNKKMLVLALILGFIGYTVSFYKSNTQLFPSSTKVAKPLKLTSSKYDLITQIFKTLEEANNCYGKEDCKVIHYGCPFGCYNLVNSAYNLKFVDEAVSKLNENGRYCMNYCGRETPNEDEIACIDHKCVNTRYLEK